MPDTPITISQVRDRMVPDPFEGLSDTLNIDTTILLAFASDISHDSVEPKDWYHHMIASQIRMERHDQLLPSFLWSACSARKLVCTREAADKALEIVEIIGTQTERQRMALLLNFDVSLSELSHEQRIHEFQQLSKYQVPIHWSLPIEVVDIDLDKSTYLNLVVSINHCLFNLHSQIQTSTCGIKSVGNSQECESVSLFLWMGFWLHHHNVKWNCSKRN